MDHSRSPFSPLALGLIALMAIGSVMMWIGLPAGLVYLASRVADSPQASMGPYLIILIGLPVGMVIIGKALGAVDRLYARVTGTADGRRVQPTWMKSMRGERGSTRKTTALDVVMVTSVGICLVVMAIWFFGFAGSSLPS